VPTLGLDNRVFSTLGEGRWLFHAVRRELSGLASVAKCSEIYTLLKSHLDGLCGTLPKEQMRGSIERWLAHWRFAFAAG